MMARASFFLVGIRLHWSSLVFPGMIVICCLTGTMTIAWASLVRKDVGGAHPHSASLLFFQIQPKSDYVQEPERDAVQNYLEDRVENAIVAATMNTITEKLLFQFLLSTDLQDTSKVHSFGKDNGKGTTGGYTRQSLWFPEEKWSNTEIWKINCQWTFEKLFQQKP